MDIGSRIRSRRRQLGWSQERLATEACRRAGIESGALGRQEIYRYEKGIRVPRDWLEPIARALGTSVEALVGDTHRGPGSLTGVWHSCYTYVSTTRGEIHRYHHVVVHEDEPRLQIDSIPGSNDSPIELRLDRDGSVLTGTWVEWTSPTGPYHGAVYHGALQLITDPTSRVATGMWVGYGKAFVVTSGPWVLSHLTSDTSERSVRGFARPAGPRSHPDRHGEGIADEPGPSA